MLQREPHGRGLCILPGAGDSPERRLRVTKKKAERYRPRNRGYDLSRGMEQQGSAKATPGSLSLGSEKAKSTKRGGDYKKPPYRGGPENYVWGRRQGLRKDMTHSTNDIERGMGAETVTKTREFPVSLIVTAKKANKQGDRKKKKQNAQKKT